VAWRKRVNAALTGLLGYRIVSVPSAAPTRAPAPDRPPKPLPADYDEEAKRIICRVRPYTMTAPDKLFALILAARHVSRHSIPGDIVECGVWRGGSMQAAALALLDCGDASRDLYLFDTFAGMPPPGDRDLRHDGRPAAELLAIRPREHDVWAVATLADVREGFSHVPYPPERVHFVEGLVEETIPARAPERIAILRLDTDWYESTRHELEHLYDRLSPGGVLVIDDYGWWKGAREAVDEFVERSGARLLLLRMASGRIAVKP
jgi:O-methyltransferase